jgi:aminopeptidase N
MLRDPRYRLPNTTMPRHYELTLTPYLDVAPEGKVPFTFDGSVTIHISATEEDVSQIVMHCNDMVISKVTVEYTAASETKEIAASQQDLACSVPYSFLTIATTEPLQLGTEYTVKMSFSGNIQNNMRGFYRSWYTDSTGIR